MEENLKQLLLKDLCARLPYGVKLLHESWNYEWDDELSLVERVVGIDEKFIYTRVIDTHTGEEYRDEQIPIDTFDDKLFLRPMSSMTEGEEYAYHLYKNNNNNLEIFNQEHHEIIKASALVFSNAIDWLNAHHFDYRGLIEKGLAIAVTEENNPYEN